MKNAARTQETESIAGFLTYRIARTHFALNAEAVAILRKSGISLGQWRVLAFIGVEGQGTVKDCIRQTRLDPAVVSRAVTSLERRKLISSSRTGYDRRVLQVALTRAGRDLYEHTLPLMQERQQRLLKALLPGEREAFLEVLDKLESAVTRDQSE